MLRIAIQSKGRMCQECIKLLDSVGVKLTIRETNPILVRSSDFPAEVLFVERDRIPELVSSGVSDVGICGEYVVKQSGISEDCIIKNLGFDRTTLSLAIPSEIKYKGIEWFIGKSIATPYPDIVTHFLKSHNVKAHVRLMHDQVYMAPKVGIADAICDKVHSGTALVSEHLKEVETVMNSEAVLIVSPLLTPQQRIIFDEFILRIDAVHSSKGKKLISMNIPVEALDELKKILPLTFNRTNLNLNTDGTQTGISLVMDEKRLWDVLERLKSLGAHEIVICSIDKIIE